MTKQSNSSISKGIFEGAFILGGFGYILVRACLEFYEIAWGTGIWFGEFSFKWCLNLLVFSLFCLVSWGGVFLYLWKRNILAGLEKSIKSSRNKLGSIKWVIILALIVTPIWFLQYTPWGIVFHGLYIRLVIWAHVVILFTILLEESDRLWTWPRLLTALLITTSAYSIAAALSHVTNYPFSLSWSEGNRLWDYSLAFGRDLYNYPVDQYITSPTSVGRQIVGGLPFLLPNISISVERLWVGLTTIIPYLLLGLAAFRFAAKKTTLWLLLALWTYIFLKQGPIHPPLVLCAVAVAIIWRKSLWIGIPVVFVTGYLAGESRFTWLFAPGIWIVMLEFSGAMLQNQRLHTTTWLRALLLGLSGMVGGYYGNTIVNWSRELLSGGGSIPSISGGAVSVSTVTYSVTAHPLLWYRLFPNATYGIGILLAMLIAVAPIIVLLVYLSTNKNWVPNTWQKVALIFPLLAFLGVGLIASTKAGGGGDLHNLDMFLLGIFFSAVIAWENGGRQWLGQINASPTWVKTALILLCIIPGVHPLSALRSFQSPENISWLVKLTDVSDAKFLELLPPQDEVDEILQTIRHEVRTRKSQGEVLFMDQRQLLTFGYVQDVPLVPEFEKKVLMNEAMSGNESYFASLYSELEAKRFSLIISEPLRAPVKDSNYQFGEENNAWVQWVVNPVLCYYEPLETYRSVQIQLLVPSQAAVGCSSSLPETFDP